MAPVEWSLFVVFNVHVWDVFRKISIICRRLWWYPLCWGLWLPARFPCPLIFHRSLQPHCLPHSLSLPTPARAPEGLHAAPQMGCRVFNSLSKALLLAYHVFLLYPLSPHYLLADLATPSGVYSGTSCLAWPSSPKVLPHGEHLLGMRGGVRVQEKLSLGLSTWLESHPHKKPCGRSLEIRGPHLMRTGQGF